MKKVLYELGTDEYKPVFHGSGSLKKLTEADPGGKGKKYFYESFFFIFKMIKEKNVNFLKFLRIIQNVKKKLEKKYLFPLTPGSA